GGFLSLWGAFVVVGNVAALVFTASQTALAERLILLHAALLGLSYLPLIYFAEVHVGQGPRLNRPVIATLLLAPAAGLALVLVVAPELIFQGFQGEGAAASTDWGPLYPALHVLFYGSLVWAITRLSDHMLRARHAILRRRTRVLVAALGIYVAFESAENLLLFWPETPSALLGHHGLGLTVTSVSLVGLAAVAYAGTSLVRESRRKGLERYSLVAAALLLPALFGALSGGSRFLDDVPPVLTLGIWRLGAAALLTYGILRFEAFHVESPVPKALLIGGLSLVCLAILVASQQTLTALGVPVAWAAAAVQGVLIAGVTLMVLRHRGWGSEDAGDVDRQQLVDEVYEAALASGTQGEPVDDLLNDLRRRLGVTRQEHALLSQIYAGGFPRASGPLEADTVLDGRYAIRTPIGEGSASIAYLAHDRLLDRDVVVKHMRMHQGATERTLRAFLQEARVTAQLEHPHIVEVHDFGYAEGGAYLIMEHMAGGSLQERLDEEGALPAAEAVRVTVEALSGLAHLHEQGISHRDVKPSNILIGANGTAKLADLGLALSMEPEETQEIVTGAGPAAGTPAYMSPQALDGRSTGPSCDLYAMGAVFYRALTGQAYLDLTGLPMQAMRHQILSRPPRAPPALVPEPLEEVWEKALAKNPQDRYQSAGAMREDLLRGLAASSHVDLEDPA
ncbi:MAG: serine/threonine-protein kinase, partial [Candidatus Thermoplasmatota archaeon]|nr:serine/threonine-protein kinase [Candidatus Thermoplasmatota archaeon]